MPAPIFYTHLDTFYLSFYSIDQLNYLNIQSNYYTVHRISTAKGFTASYTVYSYLNNEMIHFATIQHQDTLTPNYSTITIENKAFYNAGWSNILNHIIFDLRLNVSVRKMEITIDTNKNILKKLHTVYMNSNKLVINDDRFEFDNYGKTKKVKEQGYKAYFNNTATQKLLNMKTSTITQFDRFENKRNEIDENSQKHYIDEFLTPYFDTTKPYFRWEKTIFFDDLTYSNPVFVDNYTGEILSKHLYNKLSEVAKNNYTKHTEYSKMDIDFSRLEDPDYLISIFNHFSLFNHEIILDTFKNKPHFKPKYVKNYKVVKPSTRSITLEGSKLAKESLKDGFERINNLYSMPYSVTDEEIKERQLEILFSTPIPPVYIPKYRDWLI